MIYAISLIGLLAYVGSCTAAITQGAQTLVFKEVNGVPGNECLTFRNNGRLEARLTSPTENQALHNRASCSQKFHRRDSRRSMRP